MFNSKINLRSPWFLAGLVGGIVSSVMVIDLFKEQIDTINRDKLGTAAANMAFKRATIDAEIIAKYSEPSAKTPAKLAFFDEHMTREQLGEAASAMAFKRAQEDGETIKRCAEKYCPSQQ